MLASAAPLLQLFFFSFFFYFWYKLALKMPTKSLITQNTVLTVSSSDADAGLVELLVGSGPSGRAACWEPSERVHERRIELCGDGASWRPVGPVHFFLFFFLSLSKSNGFFFFSPLAGLSFTSTAPGPPLAKQESWGCPPGWLHLLHRLSPNGLTSHLS